MHAYGVSFDWSAPGCAHPTPTTTSGTSGCSSRCTSAVSAYRSQSPVNWYPNDQTVLANEQVVDGACERCGAIVEKKKLTQWYFKITDYADRLLDDLNQLEGAWPSKVLQMQRNWIGRSIGADVDFAIEGREERVTVFTTRPDTLYGATFMVVAPRSISPRSWWTAHRTRRRRASPSISMPPRRRPTSSARPPTGRRRASSSRRYATNPVNGERLPIWSADYVLADYGHGAVMAVPAHDQRDLDFALKFDLPVRVVVDTNAPITGAIPVVDADAEMADADQIDPVVTGEALAGDGRMINSGPSTACRSAMRSRTSSNCSSRRARGARRSSTVCATG